MSAIPQDNGFRKRMDGRIEMLLEQARRFADPDVRAATQEIVQGLLELHAVAFEKLLGVITERGPDGLTLIDTIAADELVGNVLLLYGLHPADLETRIRQALDNVQPYLAAHGGGVELLRVANGKVRVRMHGDWHSDVSPLVLQRHRGSDPRQGAGRGGHHDRRGAGPGPRRAARSASRCRW